MTLEGRIPTALEREDWGQEENNAVPEMGKAARDLQPFIYLPHLPCSLLTGGALPTSHHGVTKPIQQASATAVKQINGLHSVSLYSVNVIYFYVIYIENIAVLQCIKFWTHCEYQRKHLVI